MVTFHKKKNRLCHQQILFIINSNMIFKLFLWENDVFYNESYEQSFKRRTITTTVHPIEV